VRLSKTVYVAAVMVVGLSAWLPAAESIEVTAAVDKQTAYIGDLISYTITITYDSTLTLTPPPAGANLGGFDVKDYEIGEERRLEDGRLRQELEFVLRTFTTGEYVIPPLPIEYMAPDSTRKIIGADPIKIEIKSVLAEGTSADTLQPKPFKEQASLIKKNLTVWLIVGLAAILIAGILIYYFIRRRKSKEKEEYIDPRPAWEIAYADLAVLRDQRLPEKGEIKRFYFELSEIMKRYLGKKFEFNAVDMTTVEIGDVLAAIVVNADVHRDFMAFFEHADLVKFAKYMPPEQRPNEDWTAAYELVNRTKDVTAVPPMPEEPEPVGVIRAERDTDEADSDLRYMPPELRGIMIQPTGSKLTSEERKGPPPEDNADNIDNAGAEREGGGE